MTINMSTLYVWSKTIHRITVIVILSFILLMGGTGLTMKHEWAARLIPLDPGLLRAVHNTLSDWFLIALTVMAITGSYMYFFPWYVRRKATAPSPPPPVPPPAQSA